MLDVIPNSDLRLELVFAYTFDKTHEQFCSNHTTIYNFQKAIKQESTRKIARPEISIKTCFASRMPVTRGGYKSGQASQEKSTQDGGKRSTRNDYGYSEANILNDELEYEHIDDAFYSEDMYKSNNRGRGHKYL
ncbi:Uncharacterized protein Fot_20020 [Forsythia ovata]|uniref:Uncharacterized protein n=1 Tax=Forsythia ovata TaxID=205694 RepID=A0ABD1VMQ0_9LAMI